MKRSLCVILSVLLFVCFYEKVFAYDDIEFIYSEWIDYYPEGVEEVRIESQKRYRWAKEEDGNVIETEEYYDYLEGYEKIEESEKTFYRVINNEYIILNSKGELVRNLIECRKVFCQKITITPFVPNEEEPEEPPSPPEEVIVNPDTFDPTYNYLKSLFSSIFILIVLDYKIINLIMSNR